MFRLYGVLLTVKCSSSDRDTILHSKTDFQMQVLFESKRDLCAIHFCIMILVHNR